MAQKKYTDGSGVSEIWTNTKNYISAQLLGKSDTGHTHTKSEITDFPTLSTVATSGSYNDLSNKPTIPTVNNATLTIQKNGSNVATFTSNASSNVTCNITVPTKTSDLTNDNRYASCLNSGNNINFDWNSHYSGKVGIKVDITWLGGILTTDNTTIPTKTSDLTNDSGFLTSADRLPIGSYIQFAGSQAPNGFLVCNGGEISRTTYSNLFAVIGTTYGSGNGSTTFNLPNLTDRFLQGSTTSGTVKNAGLPNITGYIRSSAASATEQQGAFKVNDLDSGIFGNGGVYFWRWSFDASRSSSIYGNSSTVQPPALTCLICIKY